MSKLFMHANDDLVQSEFDWTDNGLLRVNNMVMLQSWSNFTGKPNAYGNTDKYLMLVVPESVAEELVARGVTVQAKEDRLSEDATQEDIDNRITLYLVKVKIKFNDYGPEVKMFTKRTVSKPCSDGSISTSEVYDLDKLTDSNIGCLERALIDTASCTVRTYQNPKRPGTSTTLYLNSMNILLEQSKSEFSKEWDEMERLANLYDDSMEDPF